MIRSLVRFSSKSMRLAWLDERAGLRGKAISGGTFRRSVDADHSSTSVVKKRRVSSLPGYREY